jgi:hypothetical protein
VNLGGRLEERNMFDSLKKNPQEVDECEAASTCQAAHTAQVGAGLDLQRAIGNQAVLRLISAGSDGSFPPPHGQPTPAQSFSPPAQHNTFQAADNLTVNQPGDAYEQEADRMASLVTETEAREQASGGGVADGGECQACAARHQKIQRAPSGGGETVPTPQVVGNVLASAGQPLGEDVQEFAGPLFGSDFGNVRIHNDAHAAQAAQSLDARAFTTGNDIVFGAGQYAPGTTEGKKLLTHELTHVVQQGGTTRRFVQRVAPAIVAVGAAEVSISVIMFWVGIVVAAILAIYLLIQAYDWAQRHGIGIDAALQTMIAAIGQIVSGAQRFVDYVNRLLERAGRIANKPPGCNEAIQQLSVLILLFEAALAELAAESQAPVPRADIVRSSVQQMEDLMPEIVMWIRIVLRECFPLGIVR